MQDGRSGPRLILPDASHGIREVLVVQPALPVFYTLISCSTRARGEMGRRTR